MSKRDDGGPAFPSHGTMGEVVHEGMSLRAWLAGNALASGLVRDTYPEWQLQAWFGSRNGLTREEITARAAFAFADAMIQQSEQS